MIRGKAGWWITGICAVVILVSMGYGMGQRARAAVSGASLALTPAGAPLPSIQVEPIQPQEELAAITAAPVFSTTPTSSGDQGKPSSSPQQLASDPTALDPAAPASLEESARVREIQRALKTAGFDPGPLDGQMGARTKTAVRDFQTANGLESDGKVGPKTWNKLEAHLKSAGTSND